MQFQKDSSGLSQGAPVAHPAILPDSIPGSIPEPPKSQLAPGDIYTVEEAAAYLKIKPRKLRALCRAGKGPKFFIAGGHAIRITAEALHEYCYGVALECDRNAPRAGMQKREGGA